VYVCVGVCVCVYVYCVCVCVSVYFVCMRACVWSASQQHSSGMSHTSACRLFWVPFSSPIVREALCCYHPIAVEPGCSPNLLQHGKAPPVSPLLLHLVLPLRSDWLNLQAHLWDVAQQRGHAVVGGWAAPRPDGLYPSLRVPVAISMNGLHVTWLSAAPGSDRQVCVLGAHESGQLSAFLGHE
jgi:hypothetical protein